MTEIPIYPEIDLDATLRLIKRNAIVLVRPLLAQLFRLINCNANIYECLLFLSSLIYRVIYLTVVIQQLMRKNELWSRGILFVA